ncbi:MAG: flavin reductase family protein, partial [Propionibacteriaceae bacterium]|nr:flavin reductase family protein [Propionibacteriaceae bacterium]
LRFARTAPEQRFDGVAWRGDHGLPRLEGTVSWLRCEWLQIVPGGDHTVVLATVMDAETSGDSSLGYHLREFKDVRPGSIPAP